MLAHHPGGVDATLVGQLEVSVSGRMMAKRVMGKASFIKLQDRSGQIQVRLERDRLPEGVYAAFKKWDVGDILGARGTLMRTNTGELTVLSVEKPACGQSSLSALIIPFPTRTGRRKI